MSTRGGTKVCKYFIEGECQFGPACRNSHPLQLLSPYMRQQYLDKHPPEQVRDEVAPTTKKVRMKTAAEVISRITWDELLPRELFIVGYLDRFKGIIEKPFDAFEWTNPAEADYFSLSIPEHRIMYFKYKHRKVWDKQERLDIIFNSTGSNIGIDELMKKADYEEEVKCEMAEDEPSIVPVVDGKVPDGPNFFICVRLQDPTVLERLSVLRSNLIHSVPFLQYCSLDPSKYHLTSLFFHLETLLDVKEIARILKEKSELLFSDPLPKIHLKGISTYGNSVIFAKVEENSLQEFEIFKQRLCSALEMTSDCHFAPHVTLMKVSSNCQAQKLPPLLCQEFQEFDIGTFVLDNISFCQMAKTEDFYPTVTEVRANS